MWETFERGENMKKATWIDKIVWAIKRQYYIIENKIFLHIFKKRLNGCACYSVAKLAYNSFKNTLDIGQDWEEDLELETLDKDVKDWEDGCV